MSAKLEKVDIMPPRDDGASVPAIQSVTPMALLDRALSSGADVAMIERLMGLQERWEANQARKAFDNALADAKAEIPILKKNRLVDFKNRDGTRTTYRHEDLAEVVRTAVPIMSSFGLSHRYRLRNKPGEPISVTCILSHRDGCFEENELSCAPDATGGKNAIQAVKSAVTYLERITFLASLGLAASDDDDGRAAQPRPEPEYEPPPVGSISEDQAAGLRELLESLDVNARAFLAWAKQKRIEDIPAEHYDSCVAEIKKVGARK